MSDQNKTHEPDLGVPAPKKKASGPVLITLFLVFLGFCIAAAAFAFLSKVSNRKNMPKALPEAKPVVPPASAQVAVEAPAAVEEQESEQKPMPSLALSGILFGEEGSFALINGKVVPEGGRVSGAKVEKITSDAVELSYDGRQIVLKAR